MIISFKSDVKKRKKFFTPECFAHPAKMHLGMLLWIIGKYTKPDETILDPMFGCGSTMLACLYGRNVVGVELEQKFVKMAEANWDKIKTLPKTKYELGDCQILQGDARNLEGLLVDKCVFSPPYAEANSQQQQKQADKGYFKDTGHGSPGGWMVAGRTQTIDNPDNIGNLLYGQIDKIVTSPPYENTQVPPHTQEGEELRLRIAKERGVSPDKVSYMDYTKKVDAVVTSPPYENAVHKGSGEWSESPEGRLLGGEQSAGGKMLGVPQGEDYIKSPSNIGNLKSDSYLSAMLQVYQQCYEVLKPQGLMILVLKDFIRNKQRVLLSINTLKLCERVGFVLEDWHQRRLLQQSFWRTIYYQKNPLVERLDTEDILVFRKGDGEGKIDAVVSSPPYAETGVGDWQTGRAEFQAWVIGELASKGYVEWKGKRYTESEWRAMNYGRVDGRTTKGVHKHPTNGYGKTEGQIGNLPYKESN